METTPTAGPRPLADILADLRKPIPPRLLATKTQGGKTITFAPWYHVVRLLDHYTGGRWDYEVREKAQVGSDFLITVRITVHAADATTYREGTGIESVEVKGYGDASSNAESMALRRAAAKLGLGLGLYEKKG